MQVTTSSREALVTSLLFKNLTVKILELENNIRWQQSNYRQRTRPAMAAVVVAMAGTIRPAMRFIFSRSLFSMPYILARRFCRQKQNTKSTKLTV